MGPSGRVQRTSSLGEQDDNLIRLEKTKQGPVGEGKVSTFRNSTVARKFRTIAGSRLDIPITLSASA